MSLQPYLHRITAREDLSSGEAREAMLAILSGETSTALIAAFLVALRMKGETAGELHGFASAMRERATPVDAGLNGQVLLDTCGTGGDGGATFNISTVAAFVAAAAGARVAKHGNRSLSTPCGSADILEALGARISLDAAEMARCIRQVGIGFLFAPALHPAMKYAQPARQELKMRTVFNLLGPLTNPARAATQLIGAPSAAAARLMAHALAAFEPRRAFVVHGSDGLDEVTTTGPTLVYEIRGSAVEERHWHPADFGVDTAAASELRGGGRDKNCEIARAILNGQPGPARDIVLVNAAAGLMATGIADTPRAGMEMASHAVDAGLARAKLADLVEFTQSLS